MATLYPPEITPDAPWSERRVHAALATLPDPWTVLWDIPVGLFMRPTARLRQIDFLLLNPKYGLIILEVKGGDIRVDGGEWFTRPARTTE